MEQWSESPCPQPSFCGSCSVTGLGCGILYFVHPYCEGSVGGLCGSRVVISGVGGASMTHVNGRRSLSENEGGHQARPRNVMGGRKLSHPSDRQHWAQHSMV